QYEQNLYISNMQTVALITEENFRQVESRIRKNDYELIAEDADTVLIRDQKLKIEQDKAKYEQYGIVFRDFDNPANLIDFEGFVRYLHESGEPALRATEAEIRAMIPADLPKLMEIGQYHHKSRYEPSGLPSTYETYQMIAKVLCQQDSSLWQPTLPANNHWSNWESGSL
ncbi:MAG: hypothetical protein AAFQ68_18275, partial [Bacteroidota bacterium]